MREPPRRGARQGDRRLGWDRASRRLEAAWAGGEPSKADREAALDGDRRFTDGSGRERPAGSHGSEPMNSGEKRILRLFDPGKLRRYWPVAAALVLGLVASLAVFQLAWLANLKTADVELQTRIEARHRAFETDFGDHENLIGAAVAYVEGSGGAHEEREFTAVVSKLMASHESV